ncbi:MAG TPA: SDR family NAD(P)-dependent oxidoreductase [Anaerolineales bacterium]|nr:SDR family NAD(P)-dependent oxidoreductase [Anaerolineales bacterium]
MKEGLNLNLDSSLFNYQPQSVADKSILITGGTTGIGRSTAILLAAQGARVMIFGRHEQELQDAMKDIQATGGQVLGLTADTSDPEDVQRVFREVDSQMEQLDILINNAALGYNSVMEGNYQEWQYIVKTNLLGYMAMAHEAIARMKNRGEGHIVNIGSMSANVREKDSSVYVATKAGIQGFSEALRKEVNPLGIKVTLIEPGAVGTDMQPQPPEEQRQMIENMEMLRAEDIAACILYTITQPKRCDVVNLQIRPHLQSI